MAQPCMLRHTKFLCPCAGLLESEVAWWATLLSHLVRYGGKATLAHLPDLSRVLKAMRERASKEDEPKVGEHEPLKT